MASANDPFDHRIKTILASLRQSLSSDAVAGAAPDDHPGRSDAPSRRSPASRGRSADGCKVVFSDVVGSSKEGDETGGERDSRVDDRNRSRRMATVNLDSESWALCVKIQITSNFPSEAPLVIVRRKRKEDNGGAKGRSRRKNRTEARSHSPPPPDVHAPAEIVDFISKLWAEILDEEASSDGRVDRKEERFLAEAFSFIRTRLGLGQEEAEEEEEEERREKRGKRTGRGKSLPSSGDAEEDKATKCCKKPPMKTSADVINRFIWEDAVQLSRIRVGYLDRFVGVVEEAFSLFDWGDLAEADKSALAIPKHRIEYFKVDERIVWRKADRIDDVFGSTGSGKNIHDVLRKLDRPVVGAEERRREVGMEGRGVDVVEDMEVGVEDVVGEERLVDVVEREVANDGAVLEGALGEERELRSEKEEEVVASKDWEHLSKAREAGHSGDESPKEQRERGIGGRRRRGRHVD